MLGNVRSKALLILSLAWIAGCQSREVRPKITGSEYAPLKKGLFWVYDIIESSIGSEVAQTNLVYELKIEVADSLLLSGQITYVLLRSKRDNSSSDWQVLDTWSARKDDFRLVVSEGNVPYVSLAFPLSNGKRWNGNELNNLGGPDRCTDGNPGCDYYEATQVGKRFEGPGIAYDDAVVIIENNEDDPIVRKDVRNSVYAKGIGLVYRERTVLEYCTIGTCIGKQIVERGVILKQTIKANGGL
ncbi:MAG: hypothetical protein K2U26_08940 [Cyclobacteriaceae bacterium]|nr:hypothetical protein [Cyclobacteriaceae bacterium]